MLIKLLNLITEKIVLDVKVGDVISLKEKAKTIPYVLQALESPERDVPEYIEIVDLFWNF